MKIYIRRMKNWIKLEILAIPFRVLLVVGLAALAFSPMFIENSYILRIMTFTCIFAIFAASWDFLAGYVGLFNLGHNAFFGVGAYTAALLNIHYGLSPLLTIPLGALTGVLAGLLITMPTMRLRSFYLSLVTLAFPIILAGLVVVFPSFTGGELGIYGVKLLGSSAKSTYYWIFLIMLVSLFFLWKLTDMKSRFIRTGVLFISIREDEISARASGINTTFYKALGYCISGFFAGVAGGLYAHVMRIAGPSTFELSFAFDPIIWTMVGGMGTLYGAVVGVFILYPSVELLRLTSFGDEIRIIIKAVILIVILLFMPNGLTTWIREHLEQECPRCKVVNLSIRQKCRVCTAPLHREKMEIEKKATV
jgi:branched-chain amino acid transport system permease protein